MDHLAVPPHGVVALVHAVFCDNGGDVPQVLAGAGYAEFPQDQAPQVRVDVDTFPLAEAEKRLNSR